MVEKVNEPLIKFLFDCLKLKREIDEAFIAEVIEIVVNALELDEYVTDYKINNEPWDGAKKITTASYSARDKIIIVNLQKALGLFRAHSKNFNIDYSEEEGFIYNAIMQTLLHELEHANQYKKMSFNDKNLENRILSYVSIPYYLRQEWDNLISKGYSEEKIEEVRVDKTKTAKQYYLYNPKERLAEYYSHKTMATVLKNLKVMPNVSYYEMFMLCKNNIRWYLDGLVPTEFYFEKLGLNYLWPKIDDLSYDLDFEARSSLGLKASCEETQCLKDKAVTLGRMIIK